MTGADPKLNLNGDMGVRAYADCETMDWQASPSGSVWRKRLHLVGGAESGQVTSIVRYDPNASFPAHDHPGGEEILVLEGVFSDDHGDWPEGTYLLNPEGFRHAPFSKNGCVIFVKLRQYDGPDRKHVALCVDDESWRSSEIPGIECKTLYDETPYPETTRLERWAAGTAPGELPAGDGFEILILEGMLRDEHATYRKGAWLRLPAGASYVPYTPKGCVVYRKSGALAQLHSGSSAD
ncbi:MAG: cupin domain-containing protein [Deltaproteobacteria bacterium]|nr:cupin domain-containing protein [Deltaproteobacteria bacterium]MBW2386965.1 cupin domain-containing protein [Deltaproteobacteria bacterium]MBW2723678.1 cupin domain-containing protein [Deltaproteobacteria bacterium]